MVSSESGIGRVIINSQRFLLTGRLFAGVFTIGLLGILSNKLFLFADRLLCKWKYTEEESLGTMLGHWLSLLLTRSALPPKINALMLNITLLTVEDENAAELYEQIHVQLREWIFVKKEIVHLRHPERETRRWVTNLEDWRRVIEPLLQENDLGLHVDLRIPEQADGGMPSPEHGWKIVQEIRRCAGEGLHCCVLTGLANAELQGLIADGEAIPEVLFDFKGTSSRTIATSSTA